MSCNDERHVFSAHGMSTMAEELTWCCMVAVGIVTPESMKLLTEAAYMSVHAVRLLCSSKLAAAAAKFEGGRFFGAPTGLRMHMTDWCLITSDGHENSKLLQNIEAVQPLILSTTGQGKIG